jgi:flagellar hook-associated protein 2
MVTSTYNYLIDNYKPNRPVRYTSHKSSELRKIYNNIVRISKQSPLYLLDISLEGQSYALNVKDAAMSLYTLIERFAKDDDSSIFNEKKAVSSNESAVSATIISNHEPILPTEFNIQVMNLATTQKNVSDAFRPSSQQLQAGTYQFSIDIEDDTYSFTHKIASGSTHEDTLRQLCTQINKSEIGIHASEYMEQNSNKLRLVLESESTGSSGTPIFTLHDDIYVGGRGLVEYFNLNQIYQPATNAKFKINKKTKESLSNQFTFNKSLTVSLHETTDSPVHISYAPNSDKIVKELGTITDSYNYLLSLANKNASKQRRANKLIHELDSIIYRYQNDLESCGIKREETGELSMDSFVALQAATDGTVKALFTNKDKISTDLLRQTSQITINPMDYLDQKICAYPNYESHHYPNPYLTSAYSGMLFNYYC